MRLLIVRLILALMALSTSAYAQRPGNFRILGPGGGGAMFYPAISPNDPRTVLVACDMSGSYITHDAGLSWRMFNLRGPVHFFIFDPLQPNVIYAQGIGLWRSEDDGGTWNLIYPKPGSIRALKTDSEEASVHILAVPDPVGKITAMAIDPDNSKTLYIAGQKKDGSALFVSHDAGQNWLKTESLREAADHIWIDPASPKNAPRLVLAMAHGFVTVTSAGIHEIPGPPMTEITSASAGFSHGRVFLYATSEAGAFVTADEGKTWRRSVLPGRGSEVSVVAASFLHPDIAYLSYRNLSLDGAVWMGIAKTSDAGRTWRLVWKESNHRAAPNVRGGWIDDESLGSGWSGNPLGIDVAQKDPNLVYTTDLGRTMQSRDGGAHWEQVYTRRSGDSGWTSRGLDVTTSYGVHFDPFDKKRMFITYTDIGLFRSEDGGHSWMSSTDGVPRQWRNTTYWVVLDPQVKGRMWSVNSGSHDLPRTKMWRHNSVLNFKGGVCRSDDGGHTWRKANDGMKEAAMTHILLDLSSSVKNRILYVAAFGQGVYKSSDGGKSWQLMNRGITQAQPLAWRLAEDTKGTLYVLLARRSEDGSIGNAGDGAIYRSTDGAVTWQPVAMPSGSNAPNGIAIDPRTTSRMYLAAWARPVGMHGEGGGIFLTVDGGQTWRHVLDQDQHVYDVTIDPVNPDVLYAAGFDASAWKSTDRGEHWTRIPGFDFKMGHRVIVDPYDANQIYITTFGASVWHGSVNGKPGMVDIATPELQP